jgi:hypothetical protein
MASRTVGDYEDLIATANTKKIPNERNVAFWKDKLEKKQKIISVSFFICMLTLLCLWLVCIFV